MENNQAKLLKALAKKLKSEKRGKDEIVKGLILDKDLKFTKNYPTLREWNLRNEIIFTFRNER